MRICLDAGHGGTDPGAIGLAGLFEKDVNLKMSNLLKGLLVKNSIEVIETRTVDSEVELNARSVLANTANADLFISLHCNAATNEFVSGIETYCYKFGSEGEKLAKSIQSNLINDTGRNDRGAKEGNFSVVRETEMPAVLVELCFISNPDEEDLLRQDEFLSLSAIAIAKGVCGYLGVEYVEADEEPVSEWAKEGQEFVIKNGISDGTRPKDYVTREELWTMMVRADEC